MTPRTWHRSSIDSVAVNCRHLPAMPAYADVCRLDRAREAGARPGVLLRYFHARTPVLRAAVIKIQIYTSPHAHLARLVCPTERQITNTNLDPGRLRGEGGGHRSDRLCGGLEYCRDTGRGGESIFFCRGFSTRMSCRLSRAVFCRFSDNNSATARTQHGRQRVTITSFSFAPRTARMASS